MSIDIKNDSPEIALKKLKARESVLSEFEEIAGLGSWEVNLQTKEAIWSKQSYKVYGLAYSTDTKLDTFFSMILPQYLPKAKETLSEAIKTGEVHKFICQIKRSDGEIRDLLINGRVIYDEDNTPLKLLGTTQDITEISAIKEDYKKQTKILEYQAYHDSLTALPNRALFQDRLKQSIVSAKRNNQMFALLFIDLDQFKKINDSLGHHVGDEVLIESAKRFKKILREEDTLSRLGGDEFTIILKDIKQVKGAATVAQKLINTLKKPIVTKHHTLHISASVGISIYPENATTAEDLLKFSDTAMYKAKDEGRNNFQFYSTEMTEEAFSRVVMENSLRVAIKEKQFKVYFQPQYNAQTDTIIGMEALVRWIHPHAGIISPSDFIPLAEENGLIIDIDKIVMQQAMQEFGKWYKQGLNPGKLALNLSMKQLNENTFITDLLQTIQENNFDISWLELEVTEGQVMKNPEHSIKKLNRLNNMGISIAIDDFGTGYSSLSYLKKLPVNKLKIDRSFIEDIPDDEDDIAITKAIIAIAKSLHLSIIAEGVETQEQKEFMLANNCKKIQGYYYSQPLDRDNMQKLLEKVSET